MWQQLRCDILSAVWLHSGAKGVAGKLPCSASLAISVVFIAKRAKRKKSQTRALEATFVASFTSIFINLGRRHTHTHTSTHYTRTHISVYIHTHTLIQCSKSFTLWFLRAREQSQAALAADFLNRFMKNYIRQAFCDLPNLFPSPYRIHPLCPSPLKFLAAVSVAPERPQVMYVANVA